MPNRPGSLSTQRLLTIDDYAYELLREMAPRKKGYGHFIAALVLAEHARRQERRQRVMQGNMQEVTEQVGV